MEMQAAKSLTLLRAKAPVPGASLAARLRRPVLWIRTAAGPSIGYGHLRRCLVLAGLLTDSIRVVFLTDPEDTNAAAQVAAAGIECMPFHACGRQPRIWAEGSPAGVLIDTRVEQGLRDLIVECRRRGVPVASIHDLGLNLLPSDILIDGSILPVAPDVAPHEARLFTGTSYAVLDPIYAFLGRQRRHVRQRIARVAINLGGGDNGTSFCVVVEGLRRWGRAIEVVGVPGFTPWGQEMLVERNLEPLRFRWASPNESVANVLYRSDLAITAGGLSALEALATGTPLMALAHDTYQQLTVSALARAEACVDLGRAAGLKPSHVGPVVNALDVDPGRRARLMTRGRQIVDGRGAERVAAILRESLLDGTRALSLGNAS
jgi:spore coat polysaccharide biosynthesis predicted glycosyltransferase SpsG